MIWDNQKEFVPIPEKRLAKKMYFNSYLTQFRYENSQRGIMVRYMIKTKDFPMLEKPYFCGMDYFLEKNLNNFASIYKKEFEIFRKAKTTNSMEIKLKCSSKLKESNISENA